MTGSNDNNTEWQKFAIDSVCKSITEVGKREMAQVNFIAVLLGMTSIIVLADITDSDITLPLLGLKLNRWLSVNVLLVLASLAFYRFIVTRAIHRVLIEKVNTIIRQRMVPEIWWIMAYPSFWWFHGTVLNYYPRIGKLIGSVPTVLVFFGIMLLFPFLLWRAGLATGFDFAWIISTTVSIIVIIAGFILILCSPEPKKLVGELEKTKSGDIYPSAP